MSERWKIHCGNALDVLRSMETHSVDAIVTDPPAGIGFMNAAWDKDKGGRDQWVAWLAEIFTEARRVAKPGAHALVWSLPRTSHWTAYGVENAGWELFDQVLHLFATGFPKGHNVAAAVDRVLGVEPEIVGTRTLTGNAALTTAEKGGTYGVQVGTAPPREVPVYAPTSEEAKRWAGWNTALKPAYEGWTLAMAPLSESTIARNVMRWGTGAMNVDGCRIGLAGGPASQGAPNQKNAVYGSGMGGLPSKPLDAGRWPAHLAFSHADACRPIGTKTVRAHPAWNDNRPPSAFTGAETSPVHHANDDGTEEIEVWECSTDCPVRMLDEQAGTRTSGFSAGFSGDMVASVAMGRKRAEIRPGSVYADSGGASRFFFCAKASTAERELGLEDFVPRAVNDGRDTSIDNPYQRGDTQRKNIHPTVKSVALMRWLVRLITPPNGLVLDLFAGSGTTGIATMVEGHRFVGVELDEEHARIARARIGFAEKNPRAFEPWANRAKAKVDERQIDLFSAVKAG